MKPHQLLGAYLLGGLGPDERNAFEAHLQLCAECRKEYAELAGLPELLDALPAADAVALTLAAESEPAAVVVPMPLLNELHRRRRFLRRRWTALAGAAAAACLVLGIATAPLIAREPPPDATYSVQSHEGLQFSIDLERKTWGTELAVNGSSLPQDGTLSLWIRDRAGGQDRAFAWTATPSGRVRVTGATPVQLASISSVELRDGTQNALAVITVP